MVFVNSLRFWLTWRKFFEQLIDVLGINIEHLVQVRGQIRHRREGLPQILDRLANVGAILSDQGINMVQTFHWPAPKSCVKSSSRGSSFCVAEFKFFRVAFTGPRFSADQSASFGQSSRQICPIRIVQQVV